MNNLSHSQTLLCRIISRQDTESFQKQLNASISQLSSISQIVSFMEDYGDELNPINISTVLVITARVRQPFQQIYPTDEKVTQLLQRHMQQLDRQAIANCLWAMARLSDIPTWNLTNIIHQFMQIVEKDIKQFEAQNLAIIIWAISMLRYNNKEQFIMLLEQFCCSDWHDLREGQAIANILWAIAVYDHRVSDELVAKLLTRVKEVKHFSGRDVGMSVWALHKIRYYDQTIMDKMYEVCQVEDLSQFDVANVLTAVAEFRERNWQQIIEYVDFKKLTKPQHAISAIRALAMLGADVQIAQSILDGLKKQLNPIQLSQLFKAYQSYKAHGSELVCDQEQLQQGREQQLIEVRKVIQKKGRNSSALQQQVIKVLRKMGVNFEANFLDQKLGREIDVKIMMGNEKVALTLAGYKNLVSNVNKLLGRCIDNNNVLEKVGGWRIELIPYFEFKSLKTMDEQTRYIKKILFRNLDSPEVFQRMPIELYHQQFGFRK
eukprot:TRINITY_DN114_c2_g1_i2.p1 TRINITY_DN114_c2_g1~~TRINITY_DN114_c2_g1_i2.p1  ORF type:complete len:490 (-),score=53.22 TRINITY_DN114_c2_g1_i2:2051-3520(-)